MRFDLNAPPCSKQWQRRMTLSIQLFCCFVAIGVLYFIADAYVAEFGGLKALQNYLKNNFSGIFPRSAALDVDLDADVMSRSNFITQAKQQHLDTVKQGVMLNLAPYVLVAMGIIGCSLRFYCSRSHFQDSPAIIGLLRTHSQ